MQLSKVDLDSTFFYLFLNPFSVAITNKLVFSSYGGICAWEKTINFYKYICYMGLRDKKKKVRKTIKENEAKI